MNPLCSMKLHGMSLNQSKTLIQYYSLWSLENQLIETPIAIIICFNQDRLSDNCLIEERHKKLFMILKTCQICRICGMWHAKCVCGNAPPSTLTASTSLSSSSTTSRLVFLPFLSNTAENVVILRSLRFVSFLIYSMADSM